LRVWPGQMHVFQIAAPMVPEANRSLRQIGNYIREATDPHHRGGSCRPRPCTRISPRPDRQFRVKPVAAVHNSPSNWR